MSATAASTGPTVEGVLVEQRPPTATVPAMIVLGIPGTDYRLHLVVDAPPNAGGAVAQTAGARTPDRRLHGRIFARAKRVDVVPAGGRYVEPVYGRPRRIQGRIAAADASSNSITVSCGVPFICTLTAGQSAADFAPGALVSFDIERGARFVPEA